MHKILIKQLEVHTTVFSYEISLEVITVHIYAAVFLSYL